MRRIVFLSLWFSGTLAAQQIIYVDQRADSSAANGQTWSSAYPEIQRAFARAQPGDQIWIASGVYRPGEADNATFTIPNGVAILGGFYGGETTPAQRSADRWGASATIFSGQRRQGGPVNHILTAINVADVQLDGIVIQEGGAQTPRGDEETRGGGLFMLADGAQQTCSILLTNCLFQDNSVLNRGGAIWVRGRSGGRYCLQIGASNGGGGCVFRRNRAANGGAICIGGAFGIGEVNIHDTRFERNTSRINLGEVDHGGAILLATAAPGAAKIALRDCVFIENTAEQGGGSLALYAWRNAGISARIERCTFDRNEAAYEAGALHVRADGPGSSVMLSVDSSFFRQNVSDDLGGAFFIQSNTGGHVQGVWTGCSFAENKTRRFIPTDTVGIVLLETGFRTPDRQLFFFNPLHHPAAPLADGGVFYAYCGEKNSTLELRFRHCLFEGNLAAGRGSIGCTQAGHLTDSIGLHFIHCQFKTDSPTPKPVLVSDTPVCSLYGYGAVLDKADLGGVWREIALLENLSEPKPERLPESQLKAHGIRILSRQHR